MDVEPKYFKALRNPLAITIIKSKPQIFVYLFETYEDINPQEPYHLATQVVKRNFLPDKSIETFLTEIDDLDTIAELANIPMTGHQNINMRFLLI